MSRPAASGVAGLTDLVHQTTLAGVGRRAALLHMDRLPPALAKPHHQRLARTVMATLAELDHAQSFELPHGRLAAVWRSRGPADIDGPIKALEHLLADLPQGQEVPLGQLLSLFDLPAQAAWLLDTLHAAGDAGQAARGLDPALLSVLEDSLGQADITPFLRWHRVANIERPDAAPAWEERGVSWPDLVACVCPGRNPADGGWLARRLSACLDRRILAAMTGPRELAGNRAFAIDVSVAGMLSPAFLAFDAALPTGLRGRVVLRLDAADILADAMSFCFARNFARARSYRLLLKDAGPGILRFAEAGLDYREMALTPELQADPSRLPDRDTLVLDRVDGTAQLAWARAHGCTLVKGAAVAER